MNKNLEDFKNFYNLFSTNTLKKLQHYKKNIEIDYTSSIKFIDIITKFNESYMEFKNDLQNLPNMNINSKIEFAYYSDNFLVFQIYNEDESIYTTDDWLSLKMQYFDGKYEAFICNDIWDPFEKRYNEKLDIDKNIIIAYLNFFEKHKLLCDAYIELKNKFIFGNGCNVLFSKIDGNLLENLDTFTLSFGNVFFNKEDAINAVFSLGKDLKYQKSDVKLDSIKVFDENEKRKIVDDLTHGLYINESKLPQMYKNPKEKVKVRK